MESHSGLFSIAAVLRMEMEWKKSSLRGGKKGSVSGSVHSICASLGEKGRKKEGGERDGSWQLMSLSSLVYNHVN